MPLICQEDQAMHIVKQPGIVIIWQETSEDDILWLLCQQLTCYSLRIATEIESNAWQKPGGSKNLGHRLIGSKAADDSHACLPLRANCASGWAKCREPVYEENASNLPILQD